MFFCEPKFFRRHGNFVWCSPPPNQNPGDAPCVCIYAIIFDLQAIEFFAFAALMLLDIIVLGVLAYFFKYREEPEEPKPSDQKLLNKKLDAAGGKSKPGARDVWNDCECPATRHRCRSRLREEEWPAVMLHTLQYIACATLNSLRFSISLHFDGVTISFITILLCSQNLG